MHQENQEYPELYMSPAENNNKVYKRCFKRCITDFKKSFLEYEEEKCISTLFYQR